jgi:hypothetical protein
MRSDATTVEAYLESLPEEKREALVALRQVILANLDHGFAEGMHYGMIGYFVPHDVYPAGYHCDPRQPLPYISLAAQKNHLALYLFCIYSAPGEEARFRQAWLETGKKLDMGKSCVRFRRTQDVPLEVVGEAILRIDLATHLANYERAISPRLRSGKKSSRAAKPSRE